MNAEEFFVYYCLCIGVLHRFGSHLSPNLHLLQAAKKQTNKNPTSVEEVVCDTEETEPSALRSVLPNYRRIQSEHA